MCNLSLHKKLNSDSLVQQIGIINSITSLPGTLDKRKSD